MHINENVISIISTILIFYFFLILFIYFSQSKLIYFPKRDILQTPQTLGLSYENIDIKTSDNTIINAWFIPADKSDLTILYCHGNAGNISYHLDKIPLFNQLDITTLIFDYRGYGKSQGKTTEEGTYIDAEAAWDYLINERNTDPDKLIIYGHSLGCAIASNLAVKKQAKALILEAPFTSIKDIGAETYPFIPAKMLCKFNYDNENNLRSFNNNLLILHSPEDEIIPFHHGKKLFKNASTPKTFIELSGTHNEGAITSYPAYKNKLNVFLNNLKQVTE
ncbi:MAG: alpha/beta hydrolase [bacterium]|nr:alpha/beta hydrolase [bacterium]